METCPYCGSSNIELDGQRWHCKDCDYLFDEEDCVRENLRHQISAILSAHYCGDEDHQMKLEMPLNEDDEENVGLSSLDLMWVDSVYEENDGVIWFKTDCTDLSTGDKQYIEFDDISTTDLKKILEILRGN